MNKEEIKAIFSDIQKKLDTLQNEDATFLFIGNEGNHFVIGGSVTNIKAQLLFAMIRYPIVYDIVKSCVENFDESATLYGNDIKNVKMQHLIEQNSGNDGN